MTKRSAAAFALVSVMTCWAARPAPAQQRFQAVLDAKLAAAIHEVEAGLDGVLGLALKDLTAGKTLFINEREVFPQASSIKIAVLFEVFKQAEEGRLGLGELVAVDEARKVPGSGVLVHLGHPGLSLSVRDLAVLMVVLSDNTATNLLIDRVGLGAVDKRLDGLGLPKTRLRRRMMDLKAAAEGRENVSTPFEMMTLLEKIWRGPALKEPYRKDLLGILAIPKDSPLRAGVAEGVEVAEKPGELEAVRCDSGIVGLPGRPYILSVMTTYLKRDGDGNPAIAEISRIVYGHMSRLARSSDIGRVVSDK
ncbi:MAG TPA: class A beta-lactamase-related serine hydrolase [Candidatus Aminicenantes bacterium]|nr:class A beta-lactamase-related serine hydrolase [Candidatus Aminicenantes bacterium]